MTANPRAWEGLVVDGRFPLLRYLGGGERSAVFVTLRDDQDPQKTAIKLVFTDPEKAELQLVRWKAAAKLSHPHLMRLFEMGRCRLGGTELIYVVTECADEDLSQVLPQRPLSADEARVVLEAASDVLAYLHAQGFVHGHLRPANIMAAGDQLKVSSDGLCQADGITPADDVWSLGMTLVEALTQQPEGALPPDLPEPLADITRRCLQRDPRRRWTAAEIQAKLGRGATPPKTQAKARRVGLTVALVLGLASVMGIVTLPNRYPEHRETAAVPPRAQSVQPQPEPKAVEPSVVEPKTPEPSAAMLVAAAPAPKTPAPASVAGGVVEQVLPDVLPKARQSIRGKVKVAVKVRVGPTGTVEDAQLTSPGPSKYFAGLALEAARRWRFNPPRVNDGAVSSEWLLRFEFGQSGTKAHPQELNR